ncbi:hypothetical protein LTR66_009139 [Elasticomyces elasticus]|nr:hypothetical protein LTR66_009139 [Elasticomyces elasticus]
MPGYAQSSGGWSENQARSISVREAPLPHRILCTICKKHKPAEAYSNKQLSDYKFQISLTQNKKRNHSIIKCRNCITQPATELQCTVCDRWKSLDEFSKRQRKRGNDSDKHRCRKCVDKQLSVAPEDYDDDEEGSEGSNPYEGNNDSDDENETSHDSTSGTALSSSISKISLDSPGGGTSRYFSGIFESAASRLQDPHANRLGENGKTATTLQYCGYKFDPNAYGNPCVARATPSSRAPSSAGNNTFAAAMGTSRGAWAKVRAKKVKPDPVEEDEEDSDDAWANDSDDDDDEEEMLTW